MQTSADRQAAEVLAGCPNHIVIGQVVRVHISEGVISGGMVDIAKLRPVARFGYLNCAVIEPGNVFSLSGLE